MKIIDPIVRLGRPPQQSHFERLAAPFVCIHRSPDAPAKMQRRANDAISRDMIRAADSAR